MIRINFIFSLILWASFSLLATKDYFSRQKAKTEAFVYLRDQNIPIEKIYINPKKIMQGLGSHTTIPDICVFNSV